MARLFSRDGSQGCRKSHWRDSFRSLQFKASVTFVVLTMVVTGVGAIVGLRAMGTVLLETERSRAVDWGESIACAAASDIAQRDHDALGRMARELVKKHDILYAAFLDGSGCVLGSCGAPSHVWLASGAQQIVSPAATKAWLSLIEGRRCVEVIVPVSHAAGTAAIGHAGYVHFAVDVTPTHTRLVGVARWMSWLAVGGLLLVIPICLLVTRSAIAPVRELVQTAHAIANGSMDARVHIRSRDEIGELAESFNTMATRIAGSQMELLKLNAELEERVQQRTQDLEELAARDPLTGLYNRRYFGEVIAREFAAAERYGDDLTCLMFDVDHFKLINDHYGHRTGDGILIELAAAIARELRGADVAARFGGDEFILLLPQTTATAASALADRITNGFAAGVAEAHAGLNPTLSIGAASLLTTKARSSEALIHEADVALYAAKEGGRNRLMQAAGTTVAT